MTSDQMYTLGKPIVEQQAANFYYGNKHHYQRLAIGLEDLEGELYQLMVAKYLPTIEKKPDFYTDEAFKSSFYVGCRKAMLSNVRKHITSQKRGNILRTQVVQLDAPKVAQDGYTVENDIEGDRDPKYLHEVKQAVDNCKDALVQRVLFLMANDKYSSKNQIRQRLKLPQRAFESFWERLQDEASDFCTA